MGFGCCVDVLVNHVELLGDVPAKETLEAETEAGTALD